ncbi:hypothetical protein M3Y94_00196500 [Aphelenchoides besseyi]|nr:hypothetical protein M3Y94_00196500 [Aphelenchoides besseyi]
MKCVVYRKRSPSAQLNYRIFQARFLYKKMRRKWDEPDYWDDRARVWFPRTTAIMRHELEFHSSNLYSAFFVFNILFWSYVCFNRWRENNSRYKT